MHAENIKVMTSSHMQESLELQQTIGLKQCVQIEFRLHYYLFYDKIFKNKTTFVYICIIFSKNIFF